MQLPSSPVPSPPRTSRLGRAARSASLLTFVLFSSGAISVEFDEFKCEAAMAHLANCCPGLDVAARTCMRSGCEAGRLPDLSLAESECILALACDAVRARDLCEAVARLPSNTFDDCPEPTGCGSQNQCGGPTLYQLHPPVCE